MSKEIAINKKDKALAVKELTTNELAILERKSAYQDVRQKAKLLPSITLDNGDSKVPNAAGLIKKMNNKVVQVFGESCKDIDAIQDIVASNEIRAIRNMVLDLWNKFESRGDFSECAYESMKKTMDSLIEISFESYKVKKQILEA